MTFVGYLPGRCLRAYTCQPRKRLPSPSGFNYEWVLGMLAGDRTSVCVCVLTHALHSLVDTLVFTCEPVRHRLELKDVK